MYVTAMTHGSILGYKNLEPLCLGKVTAGILLKWWFLGKSCPNILNSRLGIRRDLADAYVCSYIAGQTIVWLGDVTAKNGWWYVCKN